MTLERFQVLFLFLMCIFVASPIAAQRNATDASKAPVVYECWPHSGSINSVIELKGLRLGLGESETAEAFVIQNGIEIPARSSGGSSIPNDRQNGQQTLEIILPEEVVPGPAQIVAERYGLRSAPVTITITEWTPPVIKRLTPTTGPPGTFVSVECDNFHISDVIELTDGEGHIVKSYTSGGDLEGTSFVVPDDFPDGVLRLRIGNRQRGKNQFTRTWRNGRSSPWSTPVTLKLLDKPLPPYVQALRLEKTSWVSMIPGPDRAKKFNATPGVLIVMNGRYSVAGPDKLKVLLVKAGEVVELPVTEVNEKADRFNEISVRLPADIGNGSWEMILRASDGTEHHIPIPIFVLPK